MVMIILYGTFISFFFSLSNDASYSIRELQKTEKISLFLVPFFECFGSSIEKDSFHLHLFKLGDETMVKSKSSIA